MRRVSILLAAALVAGCGGTAEVIEPAPPAPNPTSTAPGSTASAPPATTAPSPALARRGPFARFTIASTEGLRLVAAEDEVERARADDSQWAQLYLRPASPVGAAPDRAQVIHVLVGPAAYADNLRPFDYDEFGTADIGGVSASRGVRKSPTGARADLQWTRGSEGYAVSGPAALAEDVARSLAVASGAPHALRLRLSYRVPPGYIGTTIGEPATSVLEFVSARRPDSRLRLEVYQTRLDREVLSDYFGIEAALDERSIAGTRWWFTRDTRGVEEAVAVFGDASVRLVGFSMTRPEMVTFAERTVPIAEAEFRTLHTSAPAAGGAAR